MLVRGGSPLTQCAAVTTRSPGGLSITLAVQKWLASVPAFVVNRAPTAGVPGKASPLRDGDTRWWTARASPAAMPPAAPVAGATTTTTPTVSAATSAPTAGGRENHGRV